MRQGEHLDRARAMGHALLARVRQEPAIQVFFLTFAAILFDYLLAPALNTLTPAISSGLLILLMLRSRPSRAFLIKPVASHISRWRVLVFLLLHLGMISTVWFSHSMGLGPLKDRLPDVVLSAAKYGVLLPTLVLLPWDGWRRFGQLYRAEWVAAAIALLTLYPYRLFAAAWPWYSQFLGHAAYVLAHPFVAGLQLHSIPAPLLSGPGLNVTVLFWCSGLQGIKLFQIFFVLMLVADWNVLRRRRALIGYFAGLAFMVIANAVRITLLVVAGNSFPQFVARHHLTGGWIFFTLALAVYIVLAYGWLVAHGKNQAPVNARSLLQPDLGPASQ